MFQLSPSDYDLVFNHLNEVTITCTFAHSVQQNSAHGVIYVDNLTKPQTIFISHSYGMSLLFGNVPSTENSNYQEITNWMIKHFTDVGVRSSMEWLQAFPPQPWKDYLKNILGEKLLNYSPSESPLPGRVNIYTRINFKFNKEKFLQVKRHIPEGYQTKPITKIEFDQLQGSVVPSRFWKSAEDWERRKCIGYYVTDFSESDPFISWVFCGDQLDARREIEIGVETNTAYRGKGFSKYAAFATLEYCIDNNITPIWSCRGTNIASIRLANSVGFDTTQDNIPYYELPFKEFGGFDYRGSAL